MCIRDSIKGLDPDEAAEGHIIARREVDAGFEVYELPLPACVGVKEGINLPRYPTMRGRLASKKAEMETVEASAEPGGQSQVKLKSPPEQVSETEVLGNGPEAAPAVVDILEELGVL